MPAPVSIILVVCPCVIMTWNWVTWILGWSWGDMELGELDIWWVQRWMTWKDDGFWGDMERWWVLG